MTSKRIVNHVLSSEMESAIFDAFIGYFNRHLSNNFEVVVSGNPIENADIYHFHRPNLAEYIPENSICTVHHDLNDQDRWLDINNFISAYRRCCSIVCLNSNQEKILKNLPGIPKILTIPHGVDKRLFETVGRDLPCNSSSSNFKLGFISKRYGRKVKGEYRLYEIAKRLDPFKFEFVLVGDGRIRDYEYLTGLGFTAKCYSYLPYALMPQIYDQIDALLILSNYEGGPASIPEAIFSKTPLLSVPVGMAPDVIDPASNVNGIILEGGFDTMAKQVNDFCHYRAGSIDYSEVLDWKDVVAEYERLYCEVIGE